MTPNNARTTGCSYAKIVLRHNIDELKGLEVGKALQRG